MKKIGLALLLLIILAACGPGKERKVLVIANGELTVAGTNISVGDTSNGGDNKEIDLKDLALTSYTLNSNGTKSTINIPADAGYYIVNAGTKPVFGKLMVEGKDYNVGHDLNLDEQKVLIDSLKKILAGTGISAANNSYLITTGQVVKISGDAAHTYVFAPYVSPSDIPQAKDGKPIVIYKFNGLDELQQRLQDVEASYNATPEK